MREREIDFDAGYHVRPRDGEHYARLFADAQFYSCEYHQTRLR